MSQRINKVEHWTSEIDEKLTDLNNEIDALLDYKVRNIFLIKIEALHRWATVDRWIKARVENAIAATIEPIAINVKCTELREQRTDRKDSFWQNSIGGAKDSLLLSRNFI